MGLGLGLWLVVGLGFRALRDLDSCCASGWALRLAWGEGMNVGLEPTFGMELELGLRQGLRLVLKLGLGVGMGLRLRMEIGLWLGFRIRLELGLRIGPSLELRLGLGHWAWKRSGAVTGGRVVVVVG